MKGGATLNTASELRVRQPDISGGVFAIAS